VLTPNHHIFAFFVCVFLTQLTVTLCGCQGNAERHAPVAAEEGQQLLLGGNTWFCLKVEEDY
jgi:hypothetical protein